MNVFSENKRIKHALRPHSSRPQSRKKVLAAASRKFEMVKNLEAFSPITAGLFSTNNLFYSNHASKAENSNTLFQWQVENEPLQENQEVSNPKDRLPNRMLNASSLVDPSFNSTEDKSLTSLTQQWLNSSSALKQQEFLMPEKLIAITPNLSKYSLERANQNSQKILTALFANQPEVKKFVETTKTTPWNPLESYARYAAKNSLQLPDNASALETSESPSSADPLFHENFWKMLSGLSQFGSRTIAQTAPTVGGFLSGGIGALYGLGVVYATSFLNGMLQAYLKRRLDSGPIHETLAPVEHLLNKQSTAALNPPLEANAQACQWAQQNPTNQQLLTALQTNAMQSFIPECLKVFDKKI